MVCKDFASVVPDEDLCGSGKENGICGSEEATCSRLGGLAVSVRYCLRYICTFYLDR
jgi:hypothetical protein